MKNENQTTVRSVRRQLDLSQSELAALLDVSLRTIQLYESMQARGLDIPRVVEMALKQLINRAEKGNNNENTN